MARTLCRLAFVTAITLLCLGCRNKSAPPPTEGPVPTPKAESEQQQARDVDRTPKQDIDLIQGAWIVESAEFNGEKAGPEVKKEISFVFKGDKMIIKERGQPHSEPFKLDPTKKPKTIDMWHSEDNPKDVTPGIYELEGDRLTICFVDKRGGIRPTVFESKKGSDVSLWALKRDKNAAPSIEEKEPNIAEFPTAIIGKWAFVSGETTFGLFVRDTEFTKDGRVLQQERSQKKEFVERYKYRFDKDVLVLILPEKDRDGSTERRVRIASISEDKLVATSPSGTLRRLK